VLVATLVSFIIKALAVPALVKLKEVEVPKPEAKVKSMFLPVVVVMVLPPVYADCKVMEEAEQYTRLLDESKQSVDPVDVCKPLIINVDVALVVKEISLGVSGVNINEPEV